MPLYTYACSACELRFDKKLKISERNNPENEPCPNCSSDYVKMVVGTPMVCYSQPGVLRTSDNFNDRLRGMEARSGEGNTIGRAIR